MIGENPRWRGMHRGPQNYGLASETDGVPIRAWWFPAPASARGAVIIAAGGGHTRQVMLPRSVFLVRGGYNVLAVHFSQAHG